MYEIMYNSFGSLDFGETSHGDYEIPNYPVDDWFESEEPGAAGFDPTNQVSSLDENHYAQNEDTTINPRDDTTQTVSARVKHRVAFKTKSDTEILDDGFKWRKYGKKMVKNSTNPRNYYKCSVKKCPVKKRVERDNEDLRYVITTYEGNHNHATPSGY